MPNSTETTTETACNPYEPPQVDLEPGDAGYAAARDVFELRAMIAILICWHVLIIAAWCLGWTVGLIWMATVTFITGLLVLGLSVMAYALRCWSRRYFQVAATAICAGLIMAIECPPKTRPIAILYVVAISLCSFLIRLGFYLAALLWNSGVHMTHEADSQRGD